MAFSNAKGDSKATTGMPKSPAPNRNFGKSLNAEYGNNEAAPDGKSQFGSELNPGVKSVNDYLAPSDPVRDAVIAGGARSQDQNFQTREVPKGGGSPDGFGQSSARSRQASSHSSEEKIPTSLGRNPPKADPKV